MKKIILLLVALRSLSATAQPTEPDSLRRVAKTATGTEQISAYQAISEFYYRSYYNFRNIDSCRLYAQKAYDKSQAEDEPVQAAYALRMLAKVEAREGRHERAFRTVDEALIHALESEDSMCVGKTYQTYSLLYYVIEPDLAKELYYAELALKYAKTSYPPDEYCNLLITVALSVEDTGDYAEAMTYYAEVLSQLSKGILSAMVESRLYTSLGSFYFKLEEYDEAITYMQKAYAFDRKTGDPQGQTVNLGNLALVHKAQGDYQKAEKFSLQAYALSDSMDNKTGLTLESVNLGALYIAMENYERAEYYLIQGVTLAEEAEDQINAAYGYLQLSILYLVQNKVNKATKWLRRAFDQGKTTPDKELMMEIYHHKASLDSLQGNYQDAFLSYQTYTTYKDSLLNEEKNRAIATLEIQYETAQKDNEISLLRGQNELQVVKEQEMTQRQIALIAGSVLLLSLLGVTFNRYRLKQRAVSIIQKQKHAIEEKNAENELLIREIHHRVKNNLQIILSLLNTQAHVLHDPRAVAVITESQNRVKSMALIHEKLYQANNFTKVPVRPYLSEMMHNVARTYRQPVQLCLEVEPVEIGMSTAVPLGLIVTELLTNAFKYAFDDEPGGKLRLSFGKEGLNGSGYYHLQVQDNGPGLPPDFDLNHARSFGLKLVKGLAHQLNGEVQVQSSPGTQFSIRFQEVM